MLKGSPVWGVGQGLFTDHHGLVAHNSFVHCFAETGLVGYSLWLSMIALTLYGLHRLEVADPREGDDGLRRLAHAARLALTAFLVAAFFLSRTYGAMLFLLLGLGTAVCAVAQRRGISTVPAFYRWIPAAGVFAIISVFGFWVLMKVLG
jgi:putative inorganic carbon (HCO3(-)) transporter